MMPNDLEDPWISERIAASDLQTSMPFVDRLGGAIGHLSEIRLLGPGEPFLDVFIQMALIAFERQHIIRMAVDNGLGDGGLTTHGINRHDTPREIQLLQ